jgi:hypothetical protein
MIIVNRLFSKRIAKNFSERPQPAISLVTGTARGEISGLVLAW